MRKLLVSLSVFAVLLTFVGVAGATDYVDEWIYTGEYGQPIQAGTTVSHTFDLTKPGIDFVPGTGEVIDSAAVTLAFAFADRNESVTIDIGHLVVGQTTSSTHTITVAGITIIVQSLATLNADGTLDISFIPLSDVTFYGATLTASSATPEPTSMLLLGSGLVSLGLWNRRRKNRGTAT